MNNEASSSETSVPECSNDHNKTSASDGQTPVPECSNDHNKTSTSDSQTGHFTSIQNHKASVPSNEISTLNETSSRKDDRVLSSSCHNERETIIDVDTTSGETHGISFPTRVTNSETAELAGETIIYLRVTPDQDEETSSSESERHDHYEIPSKNGTKTINETPSYSSEQSSNNCTSSTDNRETAYQQQQRSEICSETKVEASCLSDVSRGQNSTTTPRETRTREQMGHESAPLTTSTTATAAAAADTAKRAKGKDSTSALLENMKESTRRLIHHADPSLHVVTHAEKTALKILKQHGSILLTGKSGSGKSSIGYRLLREMEQEDNRIPLVLASHRQWNHIPQNRQNTKYVAFIDDVFGSSSLVESQVENWRKLFLFIYPSVESGHVMLVLSSRTEIYLKCENRLRNYAILGNIQHIYLDGHEYCLWKREKMKFIRTYFKNIVDFQKDDMARLITLDPPLGFPQCCVFFAQNRYVQKRGTEFFEKPHEFIADDIRTLKERDPVGYLVLVLVIMMGNSLNTRLLTKPSSEFREMIQELANTCISVCHPPSCAQIREKLNLLSETYLSVSNNVVIFQHQSVLDAVVVNAAHDNQELFLQFCPVGVLLDFVSIQPKKRVIFVEDDMYPALARRMTELMFTGDTNIILDHPCLRDLKFVQTLANTWTESIVSKLTHHKILQEDLRLWAYYDNGHTVGNELLRRHTETKIFSYGSIASVFIMKRLTALAKLLIPVIRKSCDLNENLVCAVFMQQDEIVMMLLDRGAVVNDVTLITACCTTPTSSDVTDMVFISQSEVIEQPDRKLSLAVQHGNIYAIQHLVDYILKHDRKTDIFTECLFQLVNQCAVSDHCIPIIPSGSIPAVEILQLLLGVSGFRLTEHLIPAAARHEETSCLEYLLEITDEKTLSSQLSEALHGASLFGTAESVNILLQKGAFSKLAIIAAAQSQESRSEKLKLLLGRLHQNAIQNKHNDMTIEHLVNLEQGGFVPLHFAVAYGNTEDITLLLDSGADMNFTSDFCFAPYQLAAYICNTDTLLSFLDIIKKQKHAFPLPVTHHVVATSMHWLSSKNMQGKLLRKIISGVSKTAQQQKKVISLLISHGTDINEMDNDRKSAIFIAAAVGSTMMVKYLHARGAKIDVVDKAGRTVLHETAKHGDLEMVEYLCECGSDVSVKDSAGCSVLLEAARSDVDSFEKLKYLIESRKTAIDDASNVICDAIPSDNIEIVEYLVSKMVNVREFDGMKNAVFFDACRYHSHAILDYMVNIWHVDVNVKTEALQHTLNGNTGLHLAVQHLSTRANDIVQCLLQNGADVDVKDEDGNTALLLSLQTLKRKSDEKVEDSDNTLYLMHMIMIKTLIEKHANVNIRDQHDNSPLHVASQITHPISVELVKHLLHKGADKDAKGRFGNTPLHHAVRNEGSQSYALIEEFVDRGSNVNAKNSNGKTPVGILLDRYEASSGSKRAELGKFKIIFDRCSHLEGYNRDVLAFGLYANYLR